MSPHGAMRGLAGQAGKQGKLYLLATDDLYEIDPKRPGVSLSEMNRDRGAHILNQLDRKHEGLVTVGADRWVVSRKVPPAP